MTKLEPRMLFGFGLLLVIATLAGIIAVCHVHEDASYGLDIVLGSLATLAGMFGQWAFSSKEREEKP